VSALAWIAVFSLILVLVLALGVAVLWRRSSADDRRLVERISGLPFRRKLRLARAMARDRRIPLAIRAIPPALVLYLAMPLDIVPDFIPVLGQLDDVIIVALGVVLLLRFTPRQVLEEHLTAMEAGVPP